MRILSPDELNNIQLDQSKMYIELNVAEAKCLLTSMYYVQWNMPAGEIVTFCISLEKQLRKELP